ncbi:MAG: hypothetical protein HYV39_04410 [Candidatus Levybacteria bacterium]|nr:hypothetical protein [Candidatus Levybacteria bacterium]
MKKLFLTLFIFTIYYLLFTIDAHAVTTTPTIPTTPEESQINKLKDRIASRVAELKLVERRGIIGTVTDVTNTQITLSDLQNTTRFIDVDELTKFASPSAGGSFGISDITKETKLGILGLYNKQSRRLLARFVDVLILPKVIHGVVAAIDSEMFTVSIATEKQTYLADVQTTTKTYLYTNEQDLIRSGFSKIKVGQRILVVGFPDKKDQSKIIPTRVTIFPEIAKNPKIIISATKTIDE